MRYLSLPHRRLRIIFLSFLPGELHVLLYERGVEV
jgi:hypothetical protein